MRTFLKIFAYICIWSTPFQLGFVFWGIWIITSTDYTLMSLSQLEFLTHYLSFFMPVIDWIYTWLWNDLLDFVLSLPIVLTQALKALVSTWLGFWILRQLK